MLDLRAEAQATHPGFTITCDVCMGLAYLDSTPAGVELVCTQCANHLQIDRPREEDEDTDG
jgi:hypothetical protein